MLTKLRHSIRKETHVLPRISVFASALICLGAPQIIVCANRHIAKFSTPAERALKWAGMSKALKPGGLLIIQGYTPKQLAAARAAQASGWVISIGGCF